jgi:hypothetical protein
MWGEESVALHFSQSCFLKQLNGRIFRAWIQGVYKTGRLVRLAHRNRTLLCRNKRTDAGSREINRKRINLRFHEFCYGLCKEHPERIGNVTMMLYCLLCYHDNTAGQVGILYSLLIKKSCSLWSNAHWLWIGQALKLIYYRKDGRETWLKQCL